MAEKLFLTPGSVVEVADLTGAHTRATQIRVLQKNGLRHFINAAGWPVVPLSAVHGGKPDPKEARWRSNKLPPLA